MKMNLRWWWLSPLLSQVILLGKYCKFKGTMEAELVVFVVAVDDDVADVDDTRPAAIKYD